MSWLLTKRFGAICLACAASAFADALKMGFWKSSLVLALVYLGLELRRWGAED